MTVSVATKRLRAHAEKDRLIEDAREGSMLSRIPFSARCRVAFRSLGLQTMGDLAGASAWDLVGVPGFGLAAFDETNKTLADFGFPRIVLDW